MRTKTILTSIGFLISSVSSLSLDALSERSITTTTSSCNTFSRRSFLATSTATSYMLLPKEACDARQTKTEEIQRIYDSQASTYEDLYSDSIISRKLDFVTLRQNLLSKARGDVLELGVGTGLNLPHYPSSSSKITSYTGIDLSPNMLEQAKLRFERSATNGIDSAIDARTVSQSLRDLYNQNKVSFQVADVELLTSIFKSDDNSGKLKTFDTIIDTFGLCVFPNPSEALFQARELLSPEGQLLLLEHQDSMVAKVLSPTRKLSDVSSSCRYDDDVRSLVCNAGFSHAQYVDLAGGFLVSVTAKK